MSKDELDVILKRGTIIDKMRELYNNYMNARSQEESNIKLEEIKKLLEELRKLGASND